MDVFLSPSLPASPQIRASRQRWFFCLTWGSPVPPAAELRPSLQLSCCARSGAAQGNGRTPESLPLPSEAYDILGGLGVFYSYGKY